MWIIGSPTDAFCTKETTENWPKFQLSFALCHFLSSFPYAQDWRDAPKLTLYSNPYASIKKEGLRQELMISGNTIWYCRNTEKELYRKLHKGFKRLVKYYLFFLFPLLCMLCCSLKTESLPVLGRPIVLVESIVYEMHVLFLEQ